MCGLAYFFEKEGLATTLVCFVREHAEAVAPPRVLWLDMPMGRPFGKPNDADFQKGIIRAAFALLDAPEGPVLADFPEVIPVRDGRMTHALPNDLVSQAEDRADPAALLARIQAEVVAMRPDYDAAVKLRGRTTVGASGLGIEELAPFIVSWLSGEKVKSPRKGVPPLMMLKLACEDLWAYYTETARRGAGDHRDGRAGRLVLGRDRGSEGDPGAGSAERGEQKPRAEAARGAVPDRAAVLGLGARPVTPRKFFARVI